MGRAHRKSKNQRVKLKKQQPPPPRQPYLPPPTLDEHQTNYPHPTNESRQAALSSEQSRLHQATRGPQRPQSTPYERYRWAQLVVAHLNSNSEAIASLVEADTPSNDALIVEILHALFCTRSPISPPVQPSSYLSWVLEIVARHPTISPLLRASHRERHRRRVAVMWLRRAAGFTYRVFKTPVAYSQWHITVLHLYLKQLPHGQEHPTPGHWIAETKAVYDLCSEYIRLQKLADSRDGRYPVERMDPDRIIRTIPPELSCLIFDVDTKELVASIVRNFSRSQTLLDWAKETIDLAVAMRRSARLEDPGLLILIGFTAGSRSHPLFALARNLRRKNIDTTEADIRNAVASAIFAKHTQMLHPIEVWTDMEAYHRKHSIPHLDSKWPKSCEASGPLALPAPGGGTITVRDIEHGPGCAIMSQNYARPVHFEDHPHKWAVSWTTLRAGTKPSGSNFFVPSYGLRIMQATDTSIAWRPSDYHTTSLGSWDPTIAWSRGVDPTFIQQGIAFVTSNRIASVCKDWATKNTLAGEAKVEGAVKDLEGDWGGSEYAGFKPRPKHL